jgi:hypothetical protein
MLFYAGTTYRCRSKRLPDSDRSGAISEKLSIFYSRSRLNPVGNELRPRVPGFYPNMTSASIFYGAV